MEFVFWGSVFLVFHAYFGYPLSLWLLSLVKNKKVRKASFMPSVTLIIAACNEEKRIREKLENTLSLDYPRNLLWVIVASDGSTDNTNAIVNEYADHRASNFWQSRNDGVRKMPRKKRLPRQMEMLSYFRIHPRKSLRKASKKSWPILPIHLSDVSAVWTEFWARTENPAEKDFMSATKCGFAVWKPKSTPWWA